VAHALTLTDVLDYIPVASSYGVAKLAAPSHFVGKTVADIGLGRGGKWNVALLLIRRDKEVIVTPDRTESVKPNDILIVSGNDDKLEQLLGAARKGSAL